MKSMLRKSILSFAVVFFAAISAYAQVPQGFNFQAVARDANGDILANTELGVQISLLQGSEDGNPLYEETHTVTTNPLGLMQIVIGEGTAADEQIFSKVDFGANNIFVKLAIDPAGGTEYADLGTTRLLSVPYAMVAQKAIEGGGSLTGTEINLNTANPDSSFIINLEGDKQAKPFQVFSKSTSDNRAITGEAFSEESNEGAQRGVLGFANGLGSGQHVGVFGGAVNFDATGDSRRGVYGQAASKAKYNYGVFGIAAGDGNGESEVDPQNGDFGSFNLGGYFQAYGNLNGNTGAQGISAGTNGNLRNFGLIGTARTTASGVNIGVRGEAFNSTTQNIAFNGDVFGSARNLGMELNINGGTSNIGMIVNADTAAILNGNSIINGDLTINGTLNYSGDLGAGGSSTNLSFDTSQPDSSFLINVTGPESGSGLISTASTNGVNAGLEGKAVSSNGNESLQVGTYGEATGEGTGTHIGLYGVSLGEESGTGDGGRRYGFYGSARSTGRENIGGFGIARGAGDGEVVALGDEFIGGSLNVGGFNIGLNGFARDNVNGNVGIRGYVYGTEGARENRAVSAEAVATATGRNVGVQSLVHSSQSENMGFQALMFDGSGNSSLKNIGVKLEMSNPATQSNYGISGFVDAASPSNTGIDLYVAGGDTNTGMNLSVNGQTGTNVGLIVNASTAAELNGNTFVNGTLSVNGDIEHAGSITQTSDRNLKENIRPLENGINTIMMLNPTSYQFRGDGEYKGLKLSRGLHYGLIAQEVEQILPNLVRNNKHTYLAPVEGAGPNNPDEKSEVKSMEYKTMNYTELIPVLIKAVQEQQQEIEKLRRKLESLEKNK